MANSSFLPSSNIHKPILRNSDNTFSTEETITVEADVGQGKRAYNIPTIVDGVRRSDDEATDLFYRGVNKHVGEFLSIEEAVADAEQRTKDIGELRLQDSEEFSFSVPTLTPQDNEGAGFSIQSLSPSSAKQDDSDFGFSIPSLTPSAPKPLTPEQENIKKIDAEKDEGWFFDVNSRAGDLIGSFGAIAQQAPGYVDEGTKQIYAANRGVKQLLTGEVEFVDDEGDWLANLLGYKNWTEGVGQQEKDKHSVKIPKKYEDVDIPVSEIIGGGLGSAAGFMLGGGPLGLAVGGMLGATGGKYLGDYLFPEDTTTTKEVAEAVQSAGSSWPSLAAGAPVGYLAYKYTKSPTLGALAFGATSALATIPLVFGSDYDNTLYSYLGKLQEKDPNYTKEKWAEDKQRILDTGITVEQAAIEKAAWTAGTEGLADFVTNSLIALPGAAFKKMLPELYSKAVTKSAAGKSLTWVAENTIPRVTGKVGFDVAGEIGQETFQTQIGSQYDTSLGLAPRELTYGEAFNKVRTQTMIAALVGSGPLSVGIEITQHLGKVKEKGAFKKAQNLLTVTMPKDPVQRYSQLIAMKEEDLNQLDRLFDEVVAQSDLLDMPLSEDMDTIRSDIQFIIEQRKAGPEAFVNPPDEDIAIGESSPEDLITLAKRFEDERAQENQNKREYSPEQEEPTPEGVQPEDLTSLAERVEQEQLSENKAFNEYRFGPGGLQAADAEALQGRVEQEKISEAKVLENFEEEAKQTAGTDIIGDVIDSDSDTSGGFGELEQELAYMMKRAEAAPEVEQESLQEEIPETLETKETNLTSELFLADPEKYINEILPLKTDEEITDIMVDGLTNPQMAYAMQDEGFKAKWEAVLAKKEESTKTAEPKEVKVNPEIAEITEDIKDHENVPGEETKVKVLQKKRKDLQISDALEQLDTENPPVPGKTEERLFQTNPREVLKDKAEDHVEALGGAESQTPEGVSFEKRARESFPADQFSDTEIKAFALLHEVLAEQAVKAGVVETTQEYFDSVSLESAQSTDGKAMGSFTPREVGGLIKAFETGDYTTLIHESGHLLENILTPSQKSLMNKSYGVGKDGVWTTENKEAFAEDWEGFMAGHKEPRGALKRIFHDMVQFLGKLYNKFADAFGFDTKGLMPETMKNAVMADVIERRTKAESQPLKANPLLDRYNNWKETGGKALSQMKSFTPEEEKAIRHYNKTGEILPSHPRHEEPSSSEKARKILEAPITEEDVERAEAAYAEARKHREESGVFTQMFPEPLGASSPHGVKELVDSIIKDAGGVKNVKDLDFLKRVLVFLSRGLDTYSFSEWQRYVGILEEVAPHLSEQEKQFFDTEYFGGFADELVGLFGERSDFDWRIENMLKIKEYPQAYEIINKVREAFRTRNRSDLYSIIVSQFAGAPSAEIVPFGDFKEMGYEQASDIPEYVAVRSKDTGDVVMFRREDLTFYYEYDDSQSFEEGLALDGGEFLGYYNGAPDKHFITVEKGDYQASNTLFQTRHTFKDSPVIEHEIPTAPTNKTGRPKEPRKMQKALTKLIGSPIRWGKPPKSVRAKDWGFGFVDDHGTGQAYFEQGDLRGFLYAQGRLLDQRHHILNPTVVKNHGKELHNFLSTETQDLINAKYQADPNAFPDVETRIVQEGLSEFFTAYILNPAEAKKRAPGFATYFEKALPQKLGKNALTDIRGVSEDLRHYVTSDEGTTHVSTQDVIDGRTPSEPSWKSRSFFAQRLTNKAHALLDAFGDLAELAGEPATRMSQAHAGDPLKIMHDKMTAKEGVASIAKQMVDKGLVSYDYTRQVTEPFSKVFQLFGRIGEKNLVEKLDKSADIQMSLHVLEKVEQNNLALLGNAVDPIIGNLYALKDPNISSIVNTALGELYALVDSGQALDSANVYKPFGDMIANLRTSISNTSSLSSKKVDRLVGKIEQVLPDLIPTIEEIRDGQWNKARIVGMGVGEETDFARASRLVDSAKQDPEYAKMREAGQFIDKWFDGLFRMLVDADIYTEEFYKVVKSSNQQYFMLTRLMDPDSSFSDEVSAATQSPQGSDKYKDIIRRLEGSDKPVQNIYNNMLLNTYRTLNEIHKNDVRSYFVDMIEMAHRVSGEPVGHFGRKVHKGEPGSIPVVRKGVKDYWSFAPEIQEGFELVGPRLNLKMPFLPWYIRKVWKPLITLLPDFWIRNGISDFQNAPLVSKRKKVAGGLGFLAAPYMLGKHFLYTMPKALSKAAKRSQELTLGGGAVGHEGIHTQKDFENAVRESMKFAAKEKKFLILDPTNWAKGLGKILRGGLEISETINRLPELERGIEDAEAAGLGRRETLQSGASDSANILNFRTGGTWTEKMNTVTGFLVAQTKGIGSHIDAIARDPSSYLGLVLWSQIPLLMLERSMVADAEREDEFKEMPWYWKHVFWNIPAPRWMVEASGGWIQWINLPKAHTIGPIASAASEIAETYFRGEKMGDLDWQEAASLMMGSAMPSVTSVGGPMQSVIEVPLGYKFHPGSYYRSPTDPKLVSERNISKASKVSREAYYLAREKFGIDTVDPRDADHIVDKWVPKVGRAMLDISSIGETGKARAEDIMYKRLGILGTANPFSNRAVQGMLEEASKHKGLRATKEFKAFMDELQNITRKDILSPDWPERHKRISSRARSLKRYFEAVGKGKVKLGQIKQEIEEKKLQRGDR